MTENRYHTARWRSLRDRVRRDQPACRICEANGRTSATEHIDHVQSVRHGGEFWDLNNLQGLCQTCHNRKTAADERAAKRGKPCPHGYPRHECRRCVPKSTATSKA